jgi:aryl-alcohol dehydrogenase-like predicted oxidoreductase
MKYNNFPGTDEKVSVLGLGTWVFGGENWGGANDGHCLDAVTRAIERGINFIDTAPFYTNGKSEEIIGRAIKGKREQVFIATKCGLIRDHGVRHDLSPASMAKELDLSLKRLQCDVIDLYQCHWPDPSTPVEETMEALVRFKAKKKIRHIGVSNFDLPLLKAAIKVAPINTLQVQYSLLERSVEKELLPFCVENNIGIIAYGPMGGGILTGKYAQAPKLGKWDARSMFYQYYAGKKFEDVVRGVDELRSFGRPLNQLALNWVRQQKGVLTAIVGCRTPEQVAENVASVGWDLSDSELQAIGGVHFSG